MPTPDEIWLAVQKKPAEEFAKRLLRSLNGRRFPVPLGSGSHSDDEFAFTLDLEFEAQFPPGPNPFEITADGDLRATLTGVVYARGVDFSFDVNKAWSAGWLRWICLQEVLGVCVLGFFIVMPNIPPIRFRIGLPIPIPVYGVNFAIDFKEIVGELDKDDLSFKAKVQLLSPVLTPNPAALQQAISRELFGVVERAVSSIPVLGPLLKHVSGFIQRIVDTILQGAKILSAVQAYLLNKLLSLVRDWIESELPDLLANMEVARMTRKFEISEGVQATQPLPPIHLYLEKMSIDVNTDCSSGHELRVQVDIDERS